MEIQSANFGFLHQHDSQLVKLAALAEQFFHSDSNTCIIKLRQYAERLAKIIAANTGLYQSSDESQARVTPQQAADILKRSQIAAQNIDLDEDQTRQIIDQKLRDRGWEVDSVNLRYSQGFRPTKGKNMAISEYPTNDGIADYALFAVARLTDCHNCESSSFIALSGIISDYNNQKGDRPFSSTPLSLKLRSASSFCDRQYNRPIIFC